MVCWRGTWQQGLSGACRRLYGASVFSKDHTASGAISL
jgi:hypothetical protein